MHMAPYLNSHHYRHSNRHNQCRYAHPQRTPMQLLTNPNLQQQGDNLTEVLCFLREFIFRSCMCQNNQGSFQIPTAGSRDRSFGEPAAQEHSGNLPVLHINIIRTWWCGCIHGPNKRQTPGFVHNVTLGRRCDQLPPHSRSRRVGDKIFNCLFEFWQRFRTHLSSPRFRKVFIAASAIFLAVSFKSPAASIWQTQSKLSDGEFLVFLGPADIRTPCRSSMNFGQNWSESRSELVPCVLESFFSLGAQAPAINEPRGGQPTRNSQCDDGWVDHLLLYLLFLAVSADIAWHIGYSKHQKTKQNPPEND